MTPTTLADALQQYQADQRARADGHIVTLRRAFMAGAMAALTTPAPREQLLAEALGFARAIGTAAESATA